MPLKLDANSSSPSINVQFTVEHISDHNTALFSVRYKDFDKPFKLAVDASDVGTGAVLLQEDEGGIDKPVSYYPKKLDRHQKAYLTREKEALALVLAVQHFKVY